MKTLRHATHTFEYSFNHRIMQCLLHVESSADAVKEGKYPATSQETERRRGKYKLLTHITDEMFEFFIELEEARDMYQSISNAFVQGNAIIRNTYHTLLLNTALQEKLKSAIPATHSDQVLFDSIYQLLLKKYLPVGNNRFRKVVVVVERTKKLAHRPQIAATEESTAKKRKVGIRYDK